MKKYLKRSLITWFALALLGIADIVFGFRYGIVLTAICGLIASPIAIYFFIIEIWKVNAKKK